MAIRPHSLPSVTSMPHQPSPQRTKSYLRRQLASRQRCLGSATYLLQRPERSDAWRSAAAGRAAAIMQPRAAARIASMKTGAQERANIGGHVLRAAALMMLVLSFPVALFAIGTAAGLLRLPYELALVDQRLPVLFRAHMASAGLALLLVPSAIACHGRSLHKVLGRSAAVLVIAGGVTALPVAM